MDRDLLTKIPWASMFSQVIQNVISVIKGKMKTDLLTQVTWVFSSSKSTVPQLYKNTV